MMRGCSNLKVEFLQPGWSSVIPCILVHLEISYLE